MDIFNLIKRNKLFAGLDDETIHRLIAQLTTIHLAKNHILFQQGDLSDGLYIVVSGRLVTLLKMNYHHERIIGDLGPGQTIGEMGVLSNEPRAMTVKAIKESVLLKLSMQQFAELCEHHPTLLMATMRVLTLRSRNLMELLRTPEPTKKHIVIVPGNQATDGASFAQQLQALLPISSDAILLSVYDEANPVLSYSVMQLDDHIDALEHQYKKIIYLLAADTSPFARYVLEKADMIYVIVEAESPPHLHQEIIDSIHQVDLAYRAKPALVLLHKQPKSFPRHTRRWLRLAAFGMHHHVRVAEAADWQRLIRFMLGKAIGVVLGGGGVRSWAHIGALKAIAEAGMPIDVIGGTSAGSIVAGYYAANGTHEDAKGALRLLSSVTRQAVAWWNLTWPAVSLFNGKEYTAAQKNIFGTIKIEDLWLPFFCVTCDLSNSTEVINRRGFLWKKIRTSTSVPGLFPPVVVNGQIRLDGGIASNLPVDAMKKHFSGVGTVVAVQLIHNSLEDKKYKFPPVLPFWQVVFAKLGITKRYHFPHFMETFLRALLVGSSMKQKECAKAADILISPDLSAYSLLSATSIEQQQLVNKGYNTAIKAIKKWKKK